MFIDKEEITEMLCGYYDFSIVTDEMWNEIDAIVKSRVDESAIDPQDDYDIYAAICDGAVGKVLHENRKP